ncbi:hypothetical protein ROHU_031207 [Labeo rohita]|uniref:Uncharacterized protein n=1 Tax=Labeo rohita TaxID=84645 RepID=A0A498LX80_LABRO|nr:hypothetical protein ROHU_031207 [Labeo rohita]
MIRPAKRPETAVRAVRLSDGVLGKRGERSPSDRPVFNTGARNQAEKFPSVTAYVPDAHGRRRRDTLHRFLQNSGR